MKAPHWNTAEKSNKKNAERRDRVALEGHCWKMALLIRSWKYRNLRLNLKPESQLEVRNQGRDVEHKPDTDKVWDAN